MFFVIKEFWSKKAWPWIKKHPWQVVLFPLTILGLLIGFKLESDKPQPPVLVPPKQDNVASEQQHEQKVEALHQQAQALLGKASQEQVAEYQKLKATGSSAEVAKWIDQF
jgi:ElaB/YqjD/DUF883 family membrane-anchored ribosome-binding protein